MDIKGDGSLDDVSDRDLQLSALMSIVLDLAHIVHRVAPDEMDKVVRATRIQREAYIHGRREGTDLQLAVSKLRGRIYESAVAGSVRIRD